MANETSFDLNNQFFEIREAYYCSAPLYTKSYLRVIRVVTRTVRVTVTLLTGVLTTLRVVLTTLAM